MNKNKLLARIAAVAILSTPALVGCDELNVEAPSQTTDTATASPAEPTPQETQSSPVEPPGSGDNSSDAADSLYHDLNMNEAQARTTLEVLPVEDPAPMSGYSQDDFPNWRSAEAWGWNDVPDAKDCDAREASLARDGTNVTIDPEDCSALDGTWVDPYTGETFTDSSDIDIDHVVSLAGAYRAGAHEWNEEQRTIYANHPLVLTASGASSNRAKGDKGPEAWKPENREAWCPYSLRWIAIKNEFGLNLTSVEERDSLEEMLSTCQEETA